jgi:hypothetical protein
VSTLLAAQEGDELARLELSPARRRSQARGAVENQHELLLTEVIVVRVGGLAGADLPQAHAQPLAAGVPSEPCTQSAEAGVLARLVEVRAFDVGQAPSVALRGGVG